jgi:hypothetical protein
MAHPPLQTDGGGMGSALIFAALAEAVEAASSAAAVLPVAADSGEEELAGHARALAAGPHDELHLYTLNTLAPGLGGSARARARRSVATQAAAAYALARLLRGSAGAAFLAQLTRSMFGQRAAVSFWGAVGRSAGADMIAAALEGAEEGEEEVSGAPPLDSDPYLAGSALNDALLSVPLQPGQRVASLHQVLEESPALSFADMGRLPGSHEPGSRGGYPAARLRGVASGRPRWSIETVVAALVLQGGGPILPLVVRRLMSEYVTAVGTLRDTPVSRAMVIAQSAAAAMSRAFTAYWARFGRIHAHASELTAEVVAARDAAQTLLDSGEAGAAVEAQLRAALQEDQASVEVLHARAAVSATFFLGRVVDLVAAGARVSPARLLEQLAREALPEPLEEEVSRTLNIVPGRTSPSNARAVNLGRPSEARQGREGLALAQPAGLPAPPPPPGGWGPGGPTPLEYATYWSLAANRQHIFMLLIARFQSRWSPIATRQYTDLVTGLVYTGAQLLQMADAFSAQAGHQAALLFPDTSRAGGPGIVEVLTAGLPHRPFARRPHVAFGDLVLAAAAALPAPAAAAAAPLVAVAAVGAAVAGLGGLPAGLLVAGLWVNTDSRLARAVVALHCMLGWVGPVLALWLATNIHLWI